MAMRRGVNLIISSAGALFMGFFLRWSLSGLLITYLPWARPEICSYLGKPQPGVSMVIPHCNTFLQSLEFTMISLLGLIVLSFAVTFKLLNMYQK